MAISVGTEKTAYDGKVASLQGKQMWTVTKDGQKVRIVDMDGDGKFTTKDKILDTGILNAEDVFEVSAIVQDEEHGGEGLSGELDTQYTAFKKAREERDAAQADYDLAQRKAKLAQRQASQPKKKSFFDKVMPWLNLTTQAATAGAMVYSTVKGDFWGLGMLGGCNWAFNGGNMADMAGLGFTGLSNSALLNSQLGSNDALWSSMGLNFSGMTGGAAGAVSTEKSALATAQNKVDAIIGNAGKASNSNSETTLTEKQKTALLSKAQGLINTIENDLTAYPNANYAKLQELAGAEAEAENLSDEDAKILQQIISAPFVDYTLIDVEGNDEKPLSTTLAKNLNTKLKSVAGPNEKDLSELTIAKRDKYNKIVNETTDWSIYTKESVKEFFTWIANNLTNPNKSADDMPELVRKS